MRIESPLRLRQLPWSHIAQSEMTDESLALEFGEHRQRLFDGSLRRSQNLADAQIDDVESVQAEVSEIVMCRVDEFLARQSLMPRLLGSAASAATASGTTRSWAR